MKILWTLFVVFIFTSQALSSLSQIIDSEYLKHSDDDVLMAVSKFCFGKTTNFCSKDNLYYVYKVENSRKNQRKKMVKNRILKAIFETINASQ